MTPQQIAALIAERDALKERCAEYDADNKAMAAIMAQMGVHLGTHNTGEKAMDEAHSIWQIVCMERDVLKAEVEHERIKGEIIHGEDVSAMSAIAEQAEDLTTQLAAEQAAREKIREAAARCGKWVLEEIDASVPHDPADALRAKLEEVALPLLSVLDNFRKAGGFQHAATCKLLNFKIPNADRSCTCALDNVAHIASQTRKQLTEL